MLKDDILKNWNAYIDESLNYIGPLKETHYPAWTIRTGSNYGVAIPYNNPETIKERFANAYLKSMTIQSLNGENISILTLQTSLQGIEEYFSVLCESFVEPGTNGSNRERISSSPLTWWNEWKELLGNKSIDERIYDTLGELLVFLYSAKKGEIVSWNGPSGASYDIEAPTRFIEVKSTVARDKKNIVISNRFQLNPPEKPLDLVFCVFEYTANTGYSIDGVIEELGRLGYNVEALDALLEQKGFEKGMSSRKKTFILHEMLQYHVDDSFPRITEKSFHNDTAPANIVAWNYTVDLSGLDYTVLNVEQ